MLHDATNAAIGRPFGRWAQVADHDWLDWRWQLRNRLTSPADLAEVLGLDAADQQFVASGAAFEVGITPYFASLCRAGDPLCPLRRQVVPDRAEAVSRTFERQDPLGEDPHRRAPGLVHKYPDRVLLLITDRCAAYCRYCTRARWVAGDLERLGEDELNVAIDYIARTPQIRDVLISGGDPLLWSSARLRRLLDRLDGIAHLHWVRIGTRVPVFVPMRIDAELVEALRPRRLPVYLNVHCNHHAELTPQAVAALGLLADAGIPLGGQSVLLRGVNDDITTLRETWYAMLGARVRPYYLFHCDPITGSSHLRTSVSEGLELMRQAVGFTSGMAVPKYCIDLEGAGKIPLWPEYVQQFDREWISGISYAGEPWRYVNRLDPP